MKEIKKVMIKLTKETKNKIRNCIYITSKQINE